MLFKFILSITIIIGISFTSLYASDITNSQYDPNIYAGKTENELTEIITDKPNVSAYMRRGFLKYESHEYSDAASNFKSAIDINKNIYDAYYYLGLSSIKSDSAFSTIDQSIIDNITAMINKSPDPAYYYARGLMHLANKSYSEAVHDITKYIASEQSSGQAYYYRGVAYFKDGKSIKGIQDLRKSSGLGYELAQQWLSDYEYNPNAYTDKNEQELSNIISSKATVSAYIKRGLIRYGAGEYSNAIENFKSALALNKSIYEAYYYLALSATMKDSSFGEIDKAIVDDLSAIIEQKSEPTYFYARGLIHFANKSYADSIPDITKFIESGSIDGQPYYYRGTAYIKEGKLLKGMQDLKKSASLGDELAQKWLKSKDISW